MMQRLAFLIAILCSGLLKAELPPSAYEKMQAEAAEFLEIEVLRVDVGPGETSDQQSVHVMALANKVNRTASGVRPGDLINISYVVSLREKGWVGPGEIPILSEKEKTVAYLVKDATTGDFTPAARAMSFRNF